MGNGHCSGCPLIPIRQLFASGTGAYPQGMTSLRVSPYFDLTPFIKFNQNLTGGGSIICALRSTQMRGVQGLITNEYSGNHRHGYKQ